MDESYKTADWQFADGSVLVEMCGVPDEPVELGRYVDSYAAEKEHPDASVCCPYCCLMTTGRNSEEHAAFCVSWHPGALPSAFSPGENSLIDAKRRFKKRTRFVAELWLKRQQITRRVRSALLGAT